MELADSATLEIWQPDPDRVPLRWLLERPDLGLVAHHVPDGDLLVEWAHAIEVDDPSAWLRGQGLVLTTGLRLPRTKQGQEEYVTSLVAAGAVALGFGTGLRFAAIPFAVVHACRAHGLALIEVPLPTPFLAVVQALTDRLAELRRARLAGSVDEQQRLTRALLRGGLAGLIRRLSRTLRAGVLLVGADGATVAAAGSDAPSRHEVVTEAVRGGAVRITAPGRVLEIQPVGSVPAEPLAWLAVARRDPLADTERLLLTHVVSLATIQVVSPQDPRLLAAGAAALASAVGGRPLSGVDALAAWGLDAGTDVSLVAISAPSEATVTAVVAGLHRQRHVVDMAWPGPTRRLLLVRTADVGSVLAALPVEVTAAASASTTLSHLAHVAPAVDRALDRAGSGARVVLDASPMGRVCADPVVRSAAAPWVDALASYDAAHGSDLTASLRAFLTHHGAWDPAAQSLGVHRHTLRHRVERAAAVAGLDLDDPAQRALLLLALWP